MRNIPKKLLAIILLLVPVFSFAATNDFTADSDITVSSVTFGAGTADMLILNSSTAESWIFSSGAFTVTNPGTFKVGSSDSSVKSIQFSSGGTTLVCTENTTPGTSSATAPTAAGTYTVSPSATTQCTSLCSAVANAASYNVFPTCGAASCSDAKPGYRLSGSGGSATCVSVGGGGIVVPCSPGYTLSGGLCYPPAIVLAATNPVTPKTGQSSAQPSISALFAVTMYMGSKSSDVYRLQQLLASDSSLYPEGLVTGYYGSLIQTAVGRFQLKYGVVSSSDSLGYGIAGPKTREKLREVFGANISAQQAEAVSQNSGTTFSQTLSRGMTDEDVRILQRLLNSDADTRLAESGIGSSGSEVNHFGSLTEIAVQKFQTKYDIVSSGTPNTTGYGLVGPKTRAKLNELLVR